MVTTFADLSHHQDVDLAAYKAAGHDRVILKATEGTGFTDGTFAARWRQAGQLGLARVAYHYARARFDGADEFNYFWSVVQSAGGMGGRDRACLDVEDTNNPAGAAVNAAEFANRAVARGVLLGLVYTGNWYARPNKVTANVFPAGWRQLWLSNYDAGTSDAAMLLPPGWSRDQLVARQFTDRATVGGVAGTCDYSRLLRDWLAQSPTPPEDGLSAEDVTAINDHTDAQVAELLRVLGANLGESAVNNPRAWLNAGIAARLSANERANLAPLLDDEAQLREAVGEIPAGLTAEDIKAALRVVLAEPAGA